MSHKKSANPMKTEDPELPNKAKLCVEQNALPEAGGEREATPDDRQRKNDEPAVKKDFLQRRESFIFIFTIICSTA
jgi:hypothetical protein